MDRERADLIGGGDRSVRRLIVLTKEKVHGAEIWEWTVGSRRIFG